MADILTPPLRSRSVSLEEDCYKQSVVPKSTPESCLKRTSGLACYSTPVKRVGFDLEVQVRDFDSDVISHCRSPEQQIPHSVASHVIQSPPAVSPQSLQQRPASTRHLLPATGSTGPVPSAPVLLQRLPTPNLAQQSQVTKQAEHFATEVVQQRTQQSALPGRVPQTNRWTQEGSLTQEREERSAQEEIERERRRAQEEIERLVGQEAWRLEQMSNAGPMAMSVGARIFRTEGILEEVKVREVNIDEPALEPESQQVRNDSTSSQDQFCMSSRQKLREAEESLRRLNEMQKVGCSDAALVSSLSQHPPSSHVSPWSERSIFSRSSA